MWRAATADYPFQVNMGIATIGARGLVFTLLLLEACATHPAGDKNLLGVLDEAGVTREEVYRRLGTPHATYERNSIAAFRLSTGRDGLYVSHAAPGWKDVRYNLLLEFDANDRLTEHRLLDVRGP